jgi:TPR repeat protein
MNKIRELYHGILCINKDIHKSIKWYINSVDAGNSKAPYNFGIPYEAEYESKVADWCYKAAVDNN